MATRTISTDELDGFELDEANRLYWRGSAVLLEQKLTLGGIERFIAGAAAASTVVLALIELLRFFGVGH